MNKISSLVQKYYVMLSLLGFSFLLILPQIISRDVIMGSDSVFHYNRFYDAAMQIKEGNFSYFISMYGFQQSGRIVNAVYGPLFAYAQGLLVLISGSWFSYQLLSRFLIALIAGSSLYNLLRQAKVRQLIALSLALFYMTTFAIQYWTMRQGFSSWGAAILPYCFIPAIRFTFYRKVEPIRLAVSVALIFQVHMLSALMLIMMYIPFFLYGFIKSDQKVLLLKRGLQSVGLFMILTANVWSVLLYLKSRNQLLDPFINDTIGLNGIDGTSSYWLITPSPLGILLVGQIIYVLIHFKNLASWKKVLHLLYFLFIFLSTGLFPWQWLLEHGNAVAKLIQFPFRFFVPATILLLMITGISVNQFTKWRSAVSWLLLGLAIVGLYQTNLNTTAVTAERVGKYIISKSKHVYVNGSYEEIKASLHSHDLQHFLKLVVKTTPDYVPVYGIRGTRNTYDLYYNHVVQNSNHVDKCVKGDQLILTWTGQSNHEVDLPVVKYRNTQLRLNGKVLSPKDYDLSIIGTPRVMSQEGENKLIVTFLVPFWLTSLIILALLSWLILGLQIGYKIYIKRFV